MVNARFLLDTNALSEVVKRQPARAFLAHFEQHQASLAVAATTWHELNYGLALMPKGPRRDEIEQVLRGVLEPSIEVLPYDKAAAAWHAQERARLRLEGKTAPYADGEIAAVAVQNQLTLVTNNEADFRCFRGLRVVNWMG